MPWTFYSFLFKCRTKQGLLVSFSHKKSMNEFDSHQINSKFRMRSFSMLFLQMLVQDAGVSSFFRRLTHFDDLKKLTKKHNKFMIDS